MFDLSSQLFWYKPIFMLELLVSVALFTTRLGRREHFAVRASLCIAALLGLAFAFPIVYSSVVWVSFMFLTLFAITVAAMKICFKESWWNILFCAIAAYTVRHISYTLFISLNELTFHLFDISIGVDPYNKPVVDLLTRFSFITFALYGISYFVGYWVGYFAYARSIHPKEDLNLGYSKIILLSGAIILVDIVLSLITEYNADINTTAVVVERIYNILSCILALQLLFSQLKQKEIYGELDTVQQLLTGLQKNYEITKENIDIINIKCHDLKHQIRAYGQKGAIDKEELEEIEQAVSIYQSTVKTGNEALDIVLMDKSLYCEKNKISLTCIADGAQLSFIRPGDIFALFGNAIDNAIEAVINLPEKKRNISFFVKRIGNAVSVYIENRFEGKMPLINKMPSTKKQDKERHGFGMLSMKTIVEKYNGTMEVEIVNDTFNLSFLFLKNHTTD